MIKFSTTAFAIAACVASATSSQAAILTIFDGISDGISTFNQTVALSGGTSTTSEWLSIASGTSIDFGDYVLSRNNGGTLFPTSYGTISGKVVDISPNGGGSFPRTDPLDYIGSGVSLLFDSAVNSVGFAVGDWATCCFGPTTDLFISFDDGAPILVATADEESDGQFGGAHEIFVAAFDDSGSFSKVSFWGNGIGEYLVFGGAVRYALLDEGSLPPPSPVPLPAAGFLLFGALGGLAALRRRRT